MCILFLAVVGDFINDQLPSALPHKCALVVDLGSGGFNLNDSVETLQQVASNTGSGFRGVAHFQPSQTSLPDEGLGWMSNLVSGLLNRLITCDEYQSRWI